MVSTRGGSGNARESGGRLLSSRRAPPLCERGLRQGDDAPHRRRHRIFPLLYTTSRTRTTSSMPSARKTSPLVPAPPASRRRDGSRGGDPPARPRLGTAFGITYPNHDRFMFMTPAKFEGARPSRRAGLRPLARVGGGGDGRRPLPSDGRGHGRPGVLGQTVHGATPLIITLSQPRPHAPAAPDLVPQVIDSALRGLSTGAAGSTPTEP